ncbi:serine/threonine-protein kinase [Aporhodopirellula aestuarii]|uniref:serine/threonine-protein kinase n=1 Tax=Aporhodopirellula aestuarii TaxID=2950107 RepID=UPI002034757F|nr:serine/threonine-protein kinase [Aporhodopirellula aestuarii]
MNQSIVDASLDSAPSLLAGLTKDQQSRLTQQLDEYLVSLENGEPLDPDQLASKNPDIAEAFASYLEKLNALYGVAVGFRDQGEEETLQQIKTGKTKLGDFTIQREIGRGGMGIVYEAIQESLSRKVAIKLLPIASLLDSRQIERFKNEAHAAGLLQHPNIVPVYSVGSDRGVHYYAMQFISGVSMDEWVAMHARDNCRTDWRSVLGWTIDIARALHAAHETGVVHRDVKPSNLMLDRESKIWITDFGLARCQTDDSITKSGDLVGTMRYMSPEQTRGQHALVDGRTDVYSLAVTLFELLTLQAAHDGEDAPAIMKMIVEQEVVSLSQVRADLPRDLETVVAKAMSKNRDGRYETAEAFADDLQRVLDGEPTIARPPTMSDRIVRLAAKHRLAVLTTVLIGMLGLVGFAASTAMIAAEKQVSDQNADRASRNEQLARKAVDRLGSQMAELLADIPSADPIRRTLLTETLAYYQTFVAGASEDPAFQEDLAITLGKIGELKGELGELDEAIASLRRCEAVYRNLADRNDQLRLNWSTSQNNLAQTLTAAGQLEEAATYFARAIHTQRSLLDTTQETPTNSPHLPIVNHRDTVVQSLATSLNNLGLLLADVLATEEAEQSYLEAITLLQDDRSTLADGDSKLQLATVLANLSGLLAKSSPVRATQYAKQALDYQTDTLEADPRNAKLATRVIVTLNTLGASQAAAGQTASSIETLLRAVEIGEQLLDRWPDQPTYRRDLVVGFNHLGLAYSKAGGLRKATQTFQMALTHGRRLGSSFPADAETQSMLGGVLNNLGFLQQQLGQSDEAEKSFAGAIEAQTRAVELAPEVKRYQQYLRKHHENLASPNSPIQPVLPATDDDITPVDEARKS